MIIISDFDLQIERYMPKICQKCDTDYILPGNGFSKLHHYQTDLKITFVLSLISCNNSSFSLPRGFILPTIFTGE